MAAPQYGHLPHWHGQQPSYQQPREGIAITTRYSAFAWVYALVKPKIYLNGYEIPSWGWGRNVLPAAPGQYHLHVYTAYWFPTRMGPADYTVAVNPGQLVELEYKAPVFTFSRGSLGPPPQSYNGRAVAIAILAATVLLMMAFFALSFVVA